LTPAPLWFIWFIQFTPPTPIPRNRTATAFQDTAAPGEIRFFARRFDDRRDK
jgi:hypothetical protein